MNSREFSHELFGSITILYDGRGNVYSVGDQIVEKLGCSKDFIREAVPDEFIIFVEDEIKKFVPEKYAINSLENMHCVTSKLNVSTSKHYDKTICVPRSTGNRSNADRILKHYSVY